MLKKLLAVVALGFSFITQAFAVAPTTIAELTAAISFADVSLGILAVSALLIAVYVVWKGASMVISAVRRG